jgi:hypothetical protein
MSSDINKAKLALKEIQEVLKKYDLELTFNVWERCYGMFQYFLVLHSTDKTFIITPKDQPESYVEEIDGNSELTINIDP